jgi:pyruvate formate lyase activating enzyme
MELGMIFDIQRFSIGNGPGIRTTFFMKGCPLRCKWCHNPEAFNAAGQLKLNRKLCRECGMCSKVCENDVHVFDENGHSINAIKCVGCNKCIDICCYGCLTRIGAEYTVDQVISVIMADKQYFDRSGGGVTFSGGEPMLQYAFIEKIIKGLDGIHIAIDTSGYCDSSTFKRMLGLVDLVLFDIKHMDSDQHKRLTGVDNSKILSNFKLAVDSGVDIKVRYPMIPDVNDDDYNIGHMTDMLKECGITSIDVSVYHNYGIEKYYDIGIVPTVFRKYSEAERNERIAYIKKCGINPIIV